MRRTRRGSEGTVTLHFQQAHQRESQRERSGEFKANYLLINNVNCNWWKYCAFSFHCLALLVQGFSSP